METEVGQGRRREKDYESSYSQVVRVNPGKWLNRAHKGFIRRSAAQVFIWPSGR